MQLTQGLLFEDEGDIDSCKKALMDYVKAQNGKFLRFSEVSRWNENNLSIQIYFTK